MDRWYWLLGLSLIFDCVVVAFQVWLKLAKAEDSALETQYPALLKQECVVLDSIRVCCCCQGMLLLSAVFCRCLNSCCVLLDAGCSASKAKAQATWQHGSMAAWQCLN